VPHFRGIRHHLKESFIKIRDIEVIPTVTKGIFSDDVVRRGIEKGLQIQRSVVRRIQLESTENFP
jgi:hypothetical protein